MNTVPETDFEKAIREAEMRGFARAVLETRQARQNRDHLERRNKHLRLAAFKFIKHLAEHLVDDAYELCGNCGDDPLDEFEIDRYKGLLLWQVTEFLTQAHIERGWDDDAYSDFDQSCVKHYQLTVDHLATWFDVVIDVDYRTRDELYITYSDDPVEREREQKLTDKEIADRVAWVKQQTS